MAFKIFKMIPLWQLCQEGKLSEVRAALARGEDVNRKNDYNRTGLMGAVLSKHNSIVRLLLEQPTVDLNCFDLNRETVLHWATTCYNVEAVRLLLADPRLSTANHTNHVGWTPVMIAIACNDVSTLCQLVAHPGVALDRVGCSLVEFARWVSFN